MSLADKSILIAEDNLVSAMVLEGMLSSLGCRVISAADGLEALEQLERAPVDLILMDCRMPRLDGYQATERIRSHRRFAELPIIAVTAGQGDDLQRCLDVGMNQVLTKPVELEILRRTLESWLRAPENPAPDSTTSTSDSPAPENPTSASNEPNAGPADQNRENRAVFAEESGVIS